MKQMLQQQYFKDRECISFFKDGTIRFALWADDANTNPIPRAFVRWCDLLAGQSSAEA